MTEARAKNQLHSSVSHLPIPARMRALPILDNGWPQLFFADTVNGKPDLRVMSPRKFGAAIKKKLCWLCGQPLGRMMAFVLGPMCTVTRTAPEPPCHYDCAAYAVKACPFLTRPHAHRREAGLPDETAMVGCGLKRNPGCAAIWITRSYKTWRPPGGGVLLTVGDPERVEWYAEGRQATRDEVMASIDSGYPALARMADEDRDPVGARQDLEAQFAAAMKLLPGETDP